MSVRVHTNTFKIYDQLPSQLERYLIEIIPDLICDLPVIKINKVSISTRKAMSLISSVRDILCFARMNGAAYVYVSESGKVTINAQVYTDNLKTYPDLIVPYNPEYQSYFSSFYSSDSSTEILREWKQGTPLITEDVCTAYSLFRNAQDRAYLRLKNGNGTLMSLIDSEDEADMITPEVIKHIDASYETQNRMYAPDGAKLTGISVSLDGIQAVLDAFWENIFRAATIPPWAYEKQQLNSSFTIEHMVMEKTRLWRQQVYPVLIKILDIYCPGCDIEILPPNFAPPKYQAEVDLIRADIKNRDSSTSVNAAQANQIKNTPVVQTVKNPNQTVAKASKNKEKTTI